MVSKHVSKSTSNMVRKRKRYQSILEALTMLVRDSPNMVSKRNQASYIKVNHIRAGPI